MKIQFIYRLFIYSLIIGISCIFTACSDEKSPEDQVNEYIESAKTAAQERSLGDFKALISDHFKGKNGYQKRDLSGLATGYFFQNKNIYLLTKTKSIYFPTPDQAEVQLVVAMAGQPINDAASLVSFRARIYAFDLVLNRQDEKWLLENARWSPANSKDLF
jgi:hypothetical protein